jgi:hypothetical protein
MKPFSELTREEAESIVKDAESVLRAEYYTDIRELATEIKDELKEKLVAGESGEPLREWLIERVDEAVDGHHRVVYTWQSQKVLLFSDNSSAYSDIFGDEGIVENGDICWSRLAWAAMRADLNEQLEAEGIDLNDPDSDDTRDNLGLASEVE